MVVAHVDHDFCAWDDLDVQLLLELAQCLHRCKQSFLVSPPMISTYVFIIVHFHAGQSGSVSGSMRLLEDCNRCCNWIPVECRAAEGSLNN